jgi:hypothetical protein
MFHQQVLKQVNVADDFLQGIGSPIADWAFGAHGNFGRVHCGLVFASTFGTAKGFRAECALDLKVYISKVIFKKHKKLVTCDSHLTE